MLNGRAVLLIAILCLILVPASAQLVDGYLTWNSSTLANNSNTSFKYMKYNYTTNSTPINMSLLFYLPLDSREEVTDYSDYRRAATVVGLGTRINYTDEGKSYGAYVFNGTLQPRPAAAQITIADATEFNINTTGMTVAFWVKVPTGQINPIAANSNGTREIMGKWNIPSNKEWMVYVQNLTGTIGVVTSNTGAIYHATVNGTTKVNDSAWHFITVTWNTTRLILYVDNVSEGTPFETNSIFEGSAPITIGKGVQAAWFNGSIDEIRYYNRAISQDERSALYSGFQRSWFSSFINFNNSLTAWYRMSNLTSDGGTNTVVRDALGAHNGTGFNLTYRAGKLGNATFFNNLTRVVFGDDDAFSPNTTGSMTMCFWMNVSNFSFRGMNPQGYINFINKYTYDPSQAAEWQWRVYNRTGSDGDNRNCRISWYGVFNSTGGTGTGSYYQQACNITEGDWIHYCGVVNSTTPSVGYTLLYVNGRLSDYDNLRDNNVFSKNTTAPFNIGSDYDSDLVENMSATVLDDMVFFNRALTPGEISTLYNAYGSFNSSYNASVLVQGTQVAQAWMSDELGNTNATDQLFTNFDWTAPIDSFTDPNDGNSTESTTVFFNATWGDNLAIRNVSFWGNQSGTWANLGTNTTPGNGSKTTLSIAGWTPGGYRVGTSGCDWTGNCDTGFSTNHTITITAVAGASCSYGGSGPWNILINDNCSLSTPVTVADEIRVTGTGGYLKIAAAIIAKRIALIPSVFTGKFTIQVQPGGRFGVYK
jgi:hypothetical protein